VSTYEQRDMSGSLFKNSKREKDTHPNATGKAMIGGKLYFVSAWTKKDRNGEAWQSLSFKPADEAQERPTPAPGRTGSLKDQLDDDLPWS
jgi:hypothetical protein